MNKELIHEIKVKYQEAGQEHVFKHFDTVGEQEQLEFAEELQKTKDPQELVKNCQQAIELAAQLSHVSHGSESTSVPVVIEPLPLSSYETIIGQPLKEKEYFGIGLDAITRGEVAVILMAGGQGTRLGSSSPKGCFDIGLPSHKSLFQIQAERLLCLQQLAASELSSGEGTNGSVEIPWYIMTSKPTYQPTIDFFKKHNYFGLNPIQIKFFNQGTLPALDLSGGKLLLESKHHLVQSPDGNGGLYKALLDNGILTDMVSKNIKHIHMYCVDNVLVKIADPVFIGYSIKNGFQLSTKVVRKRDAKESVGLIVCKNGKPNVIEYSEMDKALSCEMDAANPALLKFRSANIVNHYYNIELLKENLKKWCSSMPYHIAQKKIPYYDPVTDVYVGKEEIKSPNGIKLEQFIFDVFETVPIEKFGCLEVDRAKEFSPLKNSNEAANDNPRTSKAAYLQLGTNWLKHAGSNVGSTLVEVDAKISYSGENLEKFQNEQFAGEEYYLTQN